MHLSLDLLKPFFCCGAAVHHDKKNTTNKKPEAPEEKEEEEEEKEVVASASGSQNLVLIQPSNNIINAQTEFFNAISALASDGIFESQDSIPGLEDALAIFKNIFPKYQSSNKIDDLRSEQYPHITNVCLDYNGFGLFSILQTVAIPNTTNFALSEFHPISIVDYLNLPDDENNKNHNAIKAQIMDFLNVSKNEYDLVFTVNRCSAFELLAESYPFQTNKRLLTMFDHESESVDRMARIAREKGTTVESDWFEWPTLDCSTKLKDQISPPSDNNITRKSRLGSKDESAAAHGLFVFPVQSRVTGANYPYNWLGLARRNNWHILLDADALGPKEMDALGLSFFRPDFIIASFYRVFGHDPTGFGCLLIKKSVLPTLQGVSSDKIVTIRAVLPFNETIFPGLEEFEANLSVNKPNEVGSSQESGCGAIKIVEESMIDIKCQHLEQINMLSLDKIASRIRFLINWLVTAMMQLRLPGTNGAVQLVHIYGPQISYERGGAVAFNVRRVGGQGLISPEVVQKLAKLDGISLGVGELKHFQQQQCESWSLDGDMTTMEGGFVRVLTASLSFLSDFEDVYKLWAFVAKFLDPCFHEEGGVEHVER